MCRNYQAGQKCKKGSESTIAVSWISNPKQAYTSQKGMSKCPSQLAIQVVLWSISPPPFAPGGDCAKERVSRMRCIRQDSSGDADHHLVGIRTGVTVPETLASDYFDRLKTAFRSRHVDSSGSVIHEWPTQIILGQVLSTWGEKSRLYLSFCFVAVLCIGRSWLKRQS
ncbi:hypothetical protein HDV63DRAFT_45425 [Trichoderma sp. SZMC 28014]